MAGVAIEACLRRMTPGKCVLIDFESYQTCMQKSVLYSLTTYDPERLLDELSRHLNAKNDAQLSRTLNLMPSVISKVRHRNMAVSAFLLIRMHEATGLSIRELRFLMGDEAPKFNDKMAPLPLAKRVPRCVACAAVIAPGRAGHAKGAN